MAQLFVGEVTTVSVNFLPSRAGLTSVGYTLLNTNQTVFQARTQVGVYEIQIGGLGYGVYAVALDITQTMNGFIVWDTGQDPLGTGAGKLRVVIDDLIVKANSSVDSLVTAVGVLMEENIMKIPNAQNPTAVRIVRKHPGDPDWTTPYSDVTVPIIRTRGQERFGGPPPSP